MPEATTMTAGKLAALLRGFDEDTPVLVSGYEGGYADPGMLRLATVYDDQGEGSDEWWRGRYEDARDNDGRPTFTAVVIPR